MRSHPWTFELSGGRGLQILPMKASLYRKLYKGAAKMGVWTVEGLVWSFESVQPLTDFQDFLDSSYFYFCWSGSAYIPLTMVTLRLTSSFPLQQKGRFIVTIPLQFSYLDVNVSKCLWGFPSLPPSYTSPFSDLWALLLSRALKENSHWMGPIFSHHCPAVTPKKGASCWGYPVEWGCVSHPTWCSVGASPQQALWLLPWRTMLSLPSWSCLLFCEHCSCSDMESRPQQGSSVPICWQCLVEHFCWGNKGHW